MIYEIFPSVQSSFTCTLKPAEMAVNENKFVFWTSFVEPVWRTAVDLCYGRFNNRLRLTFTWPQTAYVEETWMPVHTECCQKEPSALWLLNMYFGRTTVLFLCFLSMLCVAMCILAVTKWKGYFPVKWKEAHEDFIFVMLDWPARGDPVIKWNLTYQSSVYAYHHNISMCIKELLSLT